MHHILNSGEYALPPAIPGSQLFFSRILIGLLQGALLVLLHATNMANIWPATEKYIFTPLLLVALLAPVLLIAALGRLNKRQAAYWFIASSVAIGLLAVSEVWSGITTLILDYQVDECELWCPPSPERFLYSVAGFHITLSLVLGAAIDKRIIPRYATCVEVAWLLLLQALFSVAMTGLLWLLLVKVMVLLRTAGFVSSESIVKNSWFLIPFTAMVLAGSLHLGEMRPAIHKALRMVLLGLFSVILVVVCLVLAGFALTLIPNGPGPLLVRWCSTLVVLITSLVLIVSINAVRWEGQSTSRTALLMQWIAKLAALALVPLGATAFCFLHSRIQEYGWTPARISAAAWLSVISLYAIGYAWAVWRGPHRPGVAKKVNAAGAIYSVVLLLLMGTPVLDPARLAVNHQLSRLETGKVTASKFDFDLLRFKGGRYGRAALLNLRDRYDGAEAELVRERAKAVLLKLER